MASPDSDSDEPFFEWHESRDDRLSFPVGRLIDTGILSGSCIGDDMRKNGLNVTRAGSIQANGAGGSPSALVGGWCKAIRHLHIDIFCVGETRLSPECEHDMIESFFL